jgi:predicted ABC-type ATPase
MQQHDGMSVVETRIPVLWISGPPGVGKSTVSWLLFTELAQAGAHVAFADTDQFCMCYPAPPGDPDREVIRVRNAGALVPRFRAAGARCVIANGVLGPVRELFPQLMPRAEVTVCRLRADRNERTGSADVCVDTSGIPAARVAGLVRESCRDWPGFSGSLPAPRREDGADRDLVADGAGGNVLLICGPAGVGKSTIGFQLYRRYLRDGRMAGYVDLDQIGFIRPSPDDDPGRHRLKAGNLAAMWRTYHAAGARQLIATGPIESDEALQSYIRALPAATVTAVRLQAGHAELTRRIMSRGAGGSWPQPGDPLRGQPPEVLLQAAGRAAAEARALERAAAGIVRIDTDGRTVAEAVDAIAAMTG